VMHLPDEIRGPASPRKRP